jgi:hypothetical protein
VALCESWSTVRLHNLFAQAVVAAAVILCCADRMLNTRDPAVQKKGAGDLQLWSLPKKRGAELSSS